MLVYSTMVFLLCFSIRHLTAVLYLKKKQAIFCLFQMRKLYSKLCLRVKLNLNSKSKLSMFFLIVHSHTLFSFCFQVLSTENENEQRPQACLALCFSGPVLDLRVLICEEGLNLMFFLGTSYSPI